MGGAGTLTEAGRRRMEESQIVIGAKRMLEGFDTTDKEILISYKPEEIGTYLKNKGKFSCAAVLLSGDVGFYSGAKKLLAELEDFHVELIPGITSMVYFCSRLRMPWEDVAYGSYHGTHLNLIQRIQRHKKTFFLLDGEKGLKTLCEKLIYYGMEEVRLYVGENLSYESERIECGTPKEIMQISVGSLTVILVENLNAKNWAARSIPDGEFIRTSVPMTKREIRSISIGKLELENDSIVYDIGGGSGSVSIEIALQAPDIQVFSIEMKQDALELMEQNKRKFAADNMEIVEGTAPDVLRSLPAPTHAFIGGSSGNLEEIITCIFEKNNHCRIVMNTIALNSLTLVMQMLEHHPEYQNEIVQIQTATAKEVGAYQLMMGHNPIYVITIWKECEEGTKHGKDA